MFALFERRLKPTATPTHPEPPSGLIAFYWHYARQAKGLFAGLFAAGFAVALLDSLIPVFIGRIVTLITGSPPENLFATYRPLLLAMAAVLLVLRPAALTLQNIRRTRRSPPMSPTSFAGKAIGTWCASRGVSSRTTSRAVSPTG